MGNIIDLTGKTFGKLYVLGRANDQISTSGKRLISWKCKCECGEIVDVRGDKLKNHMITSCGCDVIKKENKVRHKMTEEERVEFNKLYDYIRDRVMGYSKDQSLSNNMVLRLKGLRTNKFMENRNIKSTANYPYNVILMTFKYCILDIERGFRTKSFNNDMHKFNYALSIVESNLNTVCTRIMNSKKAKETTENLYVPSFGYNGAEYKKKTKESPKRLENLW